MAAPRGSWEGVLDGIDATIRLFKKFEEEADDNLDEQMEVWAYRILRKAQMYCPESDPANPTNPDFGPGYLRSTGQVIYAGLHSYSIVFGAWYAAYVHEVPEYYHKPPTQWKFLERASEEVSLEMIKEIPLGFGVRFRSIDDEGGTVMEMPFVGGTGLP